ncbi:hypothetical protein FQA39_LY13343 [Lamprigera yunnana]|nr:hypothetical protein FQA39_LY13343 [Lamprigera yunnana]
MFDLQEKLANSVESRLRSHGIVSMCAPVTPTSLNATSDNIHCKTHSVHDVHLILMSRGLETIPKGGEKVESLDVSYNNIERLPDYVFWNNSFRNVKKLSLQQNRISNISLNAFKGVRSIREIDLSDNLITSIDPYLFKTNTHFQKLIIMNNSIKFDRLQTFLLSSSLQYLVMSNNNIDQIYEVTFLGVPNLRSLILNDNGVFRIASNSFRTLNKLHYLSLANTGVYRLRESMFSQIPHIVNLEGTLLSKRFEPPLKKITGDSVTKLIHLLHVMIDEDEYTKK